MHLRVKLIVFCLTCFTFAFGWSSIEYRELEELNSTCFPSDSCREPRIQDSPGISWSSACSCNRLCSQFGTCCVDSFYNSVRRPKLLPSCRTVKLSYMVESYFMVDRCSSPDSNDHSAFETLCNDEYSRQEEGDVMRLVPVTSLLTSVTYKNYFCLRCHETTEDFLYWQVSLSSNSTCDVQPQMKDVELIYSNEKRSWMVRLAKHDISVPVNLKFDIPDQIWSLPVHCDPDVISECSTHWKEDSVRNKCHAYTAIIHVQKDGLHSVYRNVHCALCNFEPLESVKCKFQHEVSFETEYIDEGAVLLGKGQAKPAPPSAKVPFSFTHLLDINQKDGDRVGKIVKCGINYVWDPFANKCRVLTCAFPGYAIREGKCTLL